MGAGPSLLSTSFNLRLQAREALNRKAQCEREEESEKLKVKRALEKGNIEAARIHAGNAIRRHNEALRYLQYHSKLEILRNQVDTADRTKNVTLEMRKALPHLNKINTSKQLDSVELFKEFEKLFDDMTVKEEYADQTMSNATAHMAPEQDVDTLISKVADEHALDVSSMLESASGLRGEVITKSTIDKLTK
ncbi:ESCRT-related protein CHMP1B-like protein [Babesia caballi]|uniref:ESCRT-related protein CHMP1B-like protein n=1 Tax=Babesia caballi TaxID=5871 RepID=A0AAV4M2B7_BABCB|nr:ESCRT-related protein CHMP1B-like protein [Babesia caballi]